MKKQFLESTYEQSNSLEGNSGSDNNQDTDRVAVDIGEDKVEKGKPNPPKTKSK